MLVYYIHYCILLFHMALFFLLHIVQCANYTIKCLNIVQCANIQTLHNVLYYSYKRDRYKNPI
nr:MAG TPA: hypothetical protein [Inoviridae sp.]